MNILIVGNILKDVYLNLDARTEKFETDKNNTKWLDLAFNASEHHFFHRESTLGGAAISLEVLQKLGLEATVSDSNLDFNSDDSTPSDASTHRYILIADGQVSYFSPSKFTKTTFKSPDKTPDYIYIDRSANLNTDSASKILDYLDNNPNAKLVVYVQSFDAPSISLLLPKAALIFSETTNIPDSVNQDTLIKLSENQLSFTNITENISVDRVDMLTHLSLYSIASATILGSFILGKSVEESLKLARLNVENSKLDTSLSLSELQSIAENHHHYQDDIELVAKNLVLPPKGILAADESGGSIHKKFEKLNIEDTYDNRRDYRNIFFTTPDLEKYVNGVILFDETARQLADNGQNFVDFLTSKRIIPGIKVDHGLENFTNEHSEETYTKGLEGLSDRLKDYYQMGLRFAKWRAAFTVTLDENDTPVTPSDFAINENCRILAEYAKACQDANIVPIVEPELVYDGNYNIDLSAEITSRILDCLFSKLAEQKANLRACILKVNMVLAGKQEHQSTPEEVGIKTAEVLKAHVPSELAGVVFLSGGQTPEQATANLAEIIKHGPFDWPVSFSFARALQDPALFAWQGNNANVDSARTAFLERLKENQKALKKAE